MRIQFVTFFSGLIIFPVFLFSVVNKFTYFVDANTYLSGYSDPIISIVVALYPLSSFVLLILNTLIIIKLLKHIKAVDSRFNFIVSAMFFLNPYLLLIVLTLTKEQILFAAIFAMPAFGLRGRLLSGAFYLLHLLRPIYIILQIILNILSKYPRTYWFLFILVFLIVISNFEIIYSVIYLLEGRKDVVHVGRDFFNYLCVSEKVRFTELFDCWIFVFLAAPLHNDVFSLRYLIFLSLYLPYLFLMFRCLFSGDKILFTYAAISIALHFLIFWWSPTFGAFIRYFLPVTWLGYCAFYYGSKRRGFKFS